MRASFPLCCLFLAACGGQPEVVSVEEAPPGAYEPTGKVIAHVGEQPLTQEMLDVVLERVPPQQLERMKREGHYQDFLDRVALSQVLYREAIARDLHDDPEVQLTMAMTIRDVLASELMQAVGEEAVTDAAVAGLYEERLVQFARPSVKASHILVADLATATSIKKQLDAGADFAALAAEHSIDPATKDIGGDVGWFEKERMFREIAEPSFAAEKGAVIGPIETRMGYHVVRVDNKRDATPVEEVRPQLEEALREARMEEYLAELTEATPITWEESFTTGKEGGAAPVADPHADHDHAAHGGEEGAH